MGDLNLPKIIGVGGYEFAGKDTVAQAIIDLHPAYQRVGLADSLKRLAFNLNPILRFKHKPKTKFNPLSKVEYKHLADIVNQVGWDQAKRLQPVREYLQRLGTEGCRAVFGDDIWLETAYRDIQALGCGVIIPDVRFPNEGQWVKDKANSLLLWVNREGRGPINGHASARGDIRALADYEIDNNGTIEDLKAALLALPPLRGIQTAINRKKDKGGPVKTLDYTGWQMYTTPVYLEDGEDEAEEEECTGDPGTCPLYATEPCQACVKDITG